MEDAIKWWRSLTQVERESHIVNVWQLEGCPKPEKKSHQSHQSDGPEAVRLAAHPRIAGDMGKWPT
jgi:hypothetical protein